MSRLFFVVSDEGGSERPGGHFPQIKEAEPRYWKSSPVSRNTGKPAGIESCFMSGEDKTGWEINPFARE